MPPPLVSVIIPCYNLGAYLDEAVQSVLAQTVQDFEVMVVDDGSTDVETAKRLDAARWPKTSVFRTNNQGLARARNYLIARSRGTYLCALDADDKLRPQFLERTLAEFTRDPGLTFVSTRLQMFGDEQHLWPVEERSDLAMLLCDDTIITPALVRKSAVLAVGGYDERMPSQGNEDWDLWLGLVETGHRGIILHDVLFDYRRRRGSMCDQCTRGQRHLDLITYLVEKHRDSYRAHLLDVLLWKERRIADLRRQNVALEIDIGSSREPLLERRRAELQALRQKLQGTPAAPRAAAPPPPLRTPQPAPPAIDAVRAEYARALAEIEALKASASWRLTAPLRALYDRIAGDKRN
jgi:glycosyltransferase involved in cell wall biosynthesis